MAAFERFRHRLEEVLAGSISGRELTARGFREDVALAAAYGISDTAPVLRGDRFVGDRTISP